MGNYNETIQQFNSLTQGEQIATLAVAAVISVIMIVGEWKVFTKAGQRGWYSLIPFLREYKLCEIIDGSGIKFLLLFIPFVNAIYDIILSFRMAKAFGKGGGFGFGLWLMPAIFITVLGFGSAEYIGPKGER